MPRTVTIVPPKDGGSLQSTLEEALRILESKGVAIDAAVHNIDSKGQVTATILLQYADDKSRALRILATAGMDVE
jgi:hypothetical protein